MAEGIENKTTQEINKIARAMGIAPCATAALDMAIWDWKAKNKNLPLHQFLHFPPPSVPTSITIGINHPEVVKERIPLMFEDSTIKALKVKLGAPQGIEADQEMFTQVLESTKKYGIKIRVDANGGWSTSEAIFMMKWLSCRGVDYIEQPIKEGEDCLLYTSPSPRDRG